MENREGFSTGGVTVVGSDVPTDYHVAPTPRTDNLNQVAGAMAATATPVGLSPASAMIPGKKKRGRPRKYAPDGSLNALSPKPISSVLPPSPVIDFSGEKLGKVRPVGAGSVSKQQHKVELGNIGEWVACSVGANFTPHIITVNSGEDVTMKIISFSQQGPRAICILSANGVISSVTLRQPDSSGGTLTYEGRFEILSLSGSFMVSENGGTRSRSGGMSVSLASPDGRVVGGGVAGLLVAAGPVQIVVGSFLTGSQQEQKPKKHKTETISTATPIVAVPVSRADMEGHYVNSTQNHHPSNWSSLPSDSRNRPTDINASLPGN